MSYTRLPPARVLVLILLVLTGCRAANELGTVPVSGKVTYKGEAIEGATI